MKIWLISLVLLITGLNIGYSQHSNLSQSQIENLISVLNQYEDFEFFGEGFTSVKKDGKWGLINEEGKILIPIKYKEIHTIDDSDFLCVGEQNNDGYEKKNGQLIFTSEETLFQPKEGTHGSIEIENNKKFELKRKNGKWGVIDRNGRLVIPYELEEVNWMPGSDGPAKVRRGSKYGYVNEKGYLTDYIYDYAGYFKDGFAIVTKGRYYSLINEEGIEMFPFLYNYIERVPGDNYFIVTKEKMTDCGQILLKGVIDRTGRQIISCDNENITDYKYGFILTKNMTSNPCDTAIFKYLVTDFSGRNIIDGKYDKITRVGDSMFDLVSKVNPQDSIHQLFIDKNLLPTEFENVISLWKMNGMAYFPENNTVLLVKENGKWGIYDKNKGMLLPPVYEEIIGMGNTSYAKIKKDNEWAIVDVTNGKILTPFFKMQETKQNTSQSILAKGNNKENDNNNEENDNNVITAINDEDFEFLEVMEELSPAIESGDEAMVFTAVEKSADFPGGHSGLMKFIANNLRYPESAQQNNTQGRVVVKFIVEKDGSITNPEILMSVDHDLDKEAMRIISKMPKWIPAQSNGVSVRSYFNLPITFKISE